MFVFQLANASCDMNSVLGEDLNSWVINSENQIKFNKATEYTVSQTVQEGDIIVSETKEILSYASKIGIASPPPTTLVYLASI